MRRAVLWAGAGAVALAACGARPESFNPDDPAVTAQIDSIMQGAIAGSRAADADRVMAIAEGPSEFTFVTGDVLLSGVGPITANFRKTYSLLTRQDQEVLDKRVRLVAPGVAVFTAVGEGTYTDKANWTSPPVGIGLTVVFAKQADGRWQAVHAHQSIAP